jgi:hypothetical protein
MILLFSCIMHAQSKHTLFVYKNVMKVKSGFLKGGLHFTLPIDSEYRFYMYGERNILGIEEFDSISQYRKVEKELYDKYSVKACEKINAEGYSCGDTEISVEIDNRPMFDSCTIIFFYYENGFSTNNITGVTTGMDNGKQRILILTPSGIYFDKSIDVNRGMLVLKQ